MTTISRLSSRPARLMESALPIPGEERKLLLAPGIVRCPHLIVMGEPTNQMELSGILCSEEALADCLRDAAGETRRVVPRKDHQDGLAAGEDAGDTRLEIKSREVTPAHGTNNRSPEAIPEWRSRTQGTMRCADLRGRGYRGLSSHNQTQDMVVGAPRKTRETSYDSPWLAVRLKSTYWIFFLQWFSTG